MRQGQSGFTMIEILVVVTIIVVLMGLVAVIIPMAFGERDESVTQTRMDAISSMIKKISGPRQLGMPPAADVSLLVGPKGEQVGKEIGPGNDLNRGIEAVFVAIHLAGLAVDRADIKDDWLGNTDEDVMASNPTVSQSTELYEFVDAWGNPFAYFSAEDYDRPKDVGKIQMKDGSIQEVSPKKSERTGNFLNLGTFQLISAGQDQVFGTDDDIVR